MIFQSRFFLFCLSFVLAASAGAIDNTIPALVKLESGDHEPTAKLNSQGEIIGIIEAGSTFENSGGGNRIVDTHGSASLVRIESTGELVALTASHVVGGKNPWVKVNDKKLLAGHIWVDNDSDVAIVGFAKTKAEPALIFDGKNLRVAPKFMKAIDAAKIPTVMLAYYLPSHALGFALRPWVDPGVETAFTRAIVNAPLVSLNYDGTQVRIHTKVTSGASGSAVLDFREQRVTGLIVQSHYYFSETYLASADVLVAGLKSYVAGKKGAATPTVWKMHNSLTYRIFPDEAEETNFTNRPTGGVIGQPGSGVIGQPGNGIIGQPGQKAPTKFLPWAQDPLAVFSFYNLKPGMSWHKQNVIGLRVHSKDATTDWPKSFVLLAESEAFRFARENPKAFDFTAIPLETDYVALLRERLGVQNEKSARFEAVYGPNAVADDLELAPESKECILTLREDSVHVRVKTFSRMNRETWKLIPDEIEFSLGKNGAPEGQHEFLPIIETRGLKSGEKYYVDLRKFYFSDLSQLIRPMPDWSKENPPFDLTRFDRARQLKTIGFSVRNAGSGAEFTYGFVGADTPTLDLQK